MTAAAATCVKRCRLIARRIWLASCALVNSSSASGKPMSSAKLPGCPRSLVLTREEGAQRLQTRKHQIGRGYARVQGEAAPIDPGNCEAERLAAHHIGELRLPGVQDLRDGQPRCRDEETEEG